jgi:hypothetical protein
MKCVSVLNLRRIGHKASIEEIHYYQVAQQTNLVRKSHFQNEWKLGSQLDPLPYLLDRMDTFHQRVDSLLQYNLVYNWQS